MAETINIFIILRFFIILSNREIIKQEKIIQIIKFTKNIGQDSGGGQS
jgi:hypothetical protein